MELRHEEEKNLWTLIDGGPQASFPAFSIVSLSLGDKMYIHSFDPHLHAKNFNTYFYRTLSSFPY